MRKSILIILLLIGAIHAQAQNLPLTATAAHSGIKTDERHTGKWQCYYGRLATGS